MQQLVENQVRRENPGRFSPTEWNRLCRVLCRQCQAGRVLLSRGFWNETGGLSWTGDRHARPRFLRRPTRQDSLRAHHAAASPINPIAEHIRGTAMACTKSRFGWTMPNRRIGRPPGAALAACRNATVREDKTAKFAFPSIAAYGDTLHAFVERKDYRGVFLPGFRAVEGDDPVARPIGLLHIDHMVGNVGWGQMNPWVKFYRDVMGFQLYQHFDDKDISTEYSALMSKVMSNGNGRVKFPINEPAVGKKKSQIEEYLEFYGGPGVQHIAMATGNIIETVSKMRAQGIEFLRVPTTYYRRSGEAQRQDRRADRPASRLRHPGGSRRRRLHAADFHQAGGRSSDAVLRSNSTQGKPQFRQGQFQGAIRSD